MFRSGFAALVMLAQSGATSAEVPQEIIKAYNTAANSGDAGKIASAAKQLGEAAAQNAGDETAGTYAFEAGWKLCQLGDCSAAKPFASFAVSEPSDETYPTATDRALLVAFADWKVKADRKTRTALDATLSSVVDQTPSNLTVIAFRERYATDSQDNKMKRAAAAAKEAAAHFSTAKAQIPDLWASTEIFAVSSQFAYNPKKSQALAMAHVQGELKQLAAAAEADENDSLHETYGKFGDQANAWGMAMEAYFASIGKSVNDAEIDAILATYDADPASMNVVARTVPEDDGLPLCEGRLKQSPKLDYPSGAAMRGRFGAVLLGFDIEDNVLTNMRVRASVPNEIFEEEAMKTVSKWVWVPEKDQDLAACDGSRTNIVQPLVFQLQ